ncbi:hypothetical protein GCM10022197_29910 [Microlunatus spumicola]|uniref:Uncharacterized protein n=1 Tax=Microlunatus spumicola TaxID=81499 RepID=A0ABP6XX44_9ACTN
MLHGSEPLSGAHIEPLKLLAVQRATAGLGLAGCSDVAEFAGSPDRTDRYLIQKPAHLIA